MKMNFRQRNNQGNRAAVSYRARVLLVLLCIIILAVVVFSSSVAGNLAAATHTIARPFWKTAAWMSDRAVTIQAYFSAKRSLAEENERLERELEENKTSLLRTALLEEENIRLKELLGRASSEDRLLAVILVKPPRSLYDTLILDVGRNARVAVGNKVVVDGDIILGEVEEVYADTAKVRMYSSPGQTFDATVGPSALPMVAVGQGGGNFKAELPRGVAVAVGDPILLPLLSPLVFGTVGEIVVTPTDSLQTILFKNPINISETKWVEIIRGGGGVSASNRALFTASSTPAINSSTSTP